MGTLKNELVHQQGYQTREEARREVTEYIEIICSRRRRHSLPGNLSPAAFVRQRVRQASA